MINGTVPLRICNPFDKEVKLYQGMQLGEGEVIPDTLIVASVSEDEDIALMSGETGRTEDEDQILQKLWQEADITHAEKDCLRKYLEHHKQVFSIKGELGRYDKHLFTIDTGSSKPIRQMLLLITGRQKWIDN